jgi:hypothetical protein
MRDVLAPILLVAGGGSIGIGLASWNVGEMPCAIATDALSRDRCQGDVVREQRGAKEAAAEAGRIQDPVIRTVAVLGWVRDHRGNVDQSQANTLCGVLRDGDRQSCVRKLSAAHLRR